MTQLFNQHLAFAIVSGTDARVHLNADQITRRPRKLPSLPVTDLVDFRKILMRHLNAVWSRLALGPWIALRLSTLFVYLQPFDYNFLPLIPLLPSLPPLSWDLNVAGGVAERPIRLFTHHQFIWFLLLDYFGVVVLSHLIDSICRPTDYSIYTLRFHVNQFAIDVIDADVILLSLLASCDMQLAIKSYPSVLLRIHALMRMIMK